MQVSTILHQPVSLFAVLLIQFAPGLPARAQQAVATPAAANKIYKLAERELPPTIYNLYRIVDRLSRANGLDSSPWRIAMSSKYEVNAFAADRNLIAVYAGLYDQVYGDTAALACVIGHEMAHHTARHISRQTAFEAMTTGIADKELQAEIQSRVGQVQMGNLMGRVVEGFLGIRIPGLWQDVDPEELAKKKKQELQMRLNEFSRIQEFEADALGYRYMATAGYDPQGCIRVMDVLSRGESSEFETSHPVVRGRIEQLQRLMLESPPASLAAKGRSLLASTLPLTYSRSLDQQSLRVNSRFASRAGSRQGQAWAH